MMITLLEAIDRLVSQGFTEHFAVRGTHLRGLDSGALFESNEVVICGFDRVEGISDPDDLAIVYALETHRGLRGTLADAFGVYASPVIGAFLDKVSIRPQERSRP